MKPGMKFGIIGCGQMGENILKGLLKASAITPDTTILSTNIEEQATELRERYPQMTVTLDNKDVVAQSDVLLLATPPDAAKPVLHEIKALLEGKTVMSICAGIPLSKLVEWSDNAQIMRAMPNTPCSIGEGTVVISAPSHLKTDNLDTAKSLLSATGLCMTLDEKHMDTVTALAAAGPAFAFVILEALADGAVMMGLPRHKALQLTSQTFKGAAQLQLETQEHPAALKDQVTTPGGLTTAGLLIMEDGRIRSTLARTVQRAAQRAQELLESNK